jgi:hypothetical protein
LQTLNPQHLDFGDVINMTTNDEEKHLLKDFTAPHAEELKHGIHYSHGAGEWLRIKADPHQHGLIKLIYRSYTEDLNQHLANFEEFYNTLKMNRVTHDAIKIRLFLFSLRD